MSKVSDENLIKILKEKQRQSNTQDLGAVSDPELLEKLKLKQAEAVKSEKTDVKETTDVQSTAVPEGSIIGNFFRTADYMAMSVLAEPIAGIAGLGATLLSGGDANKGVKALESTREMIAPLPETQGARENLESIGSFLQPVGEVMETVGQASGDVAYEWTGSPELAAVFYSLPTAALEIAGLKGASGIKRMSNADLFRAQKAALLDPELKYDPSLATVKLNREGQLVEDSAGKRLVNNGVREGDAAVITNSTPATKKRMAEMVDIFEKSKGNTIDAMSLKTTKPIGESVTARLSKAKGMRRILGEKLDEIVNSDIGQTKVDISPAFQAITDVFKGEGIKPRIKPTGLELDKDWYKGTAFELKTLSGARTAIEDVVKLLDMKAPTGTTTLKKAHQIKKNLDEMISPEVLSEAGISPQIARKIAELRRNINDSLSSVGDYGEVNRQLSEAIQAMSPFEKFIKPGQSWDSADISAVVGESLKNLSGDSAFSVQMISDLSKLESFMRKYNANLPDDPRALIRLRETLVENFNSDPRIPGAESTTAAAGSLAASAAVGNTFGAVHDAAKLVRAGISKSKAKKIARDHLKTFNTIKYVVNNP